ncbi:TetR/AcrR family transcriptional regulator [Actinophytocola gossypii]|uniref:TetR/AcrR family transcriptional regulator n=1 Tax=Actinophytocola gossypii TaxID=2812003 RepID=A0ABT2J6H0_9PSEU|nr:TetR/AcrR family transcriptional regulator [Actinophytocola gossypii]MCT2583455.1 TetR/AcrR family transcriptional regulator [Actinophytocola gossypii]
MTNNRERIIEAAIALLGEGGRDAVSTRAVSAAAGVQAPAIYRIFGDKQGLLDAVATHGFEAYLRSKTAQPPTDDPVADLRRGWDLHVEFGLTNPALYTLTYGDQRPGVEPPAARQASAILAGLIHRIAAAGRLRVPEEQAAHLAHAGGRGVTLTLISLPEDQRDPTLSTIAREAVIARITTDPTPESDHGPAPAAVALRAVLPDTDALTTRERDLMSEWLDRIAAAG